MDGVLLVDQVVGDGALVPRGRHRPVDGGPRRGHVVVRGGVVEQVDDAMEVGLVPDGQLDRRHARPERSPDLAQHAVEVGSLPVQLVDHDDPRHAQPRRRPPGVLRLGLHPVGRTDDHDRQVGVGQRGHHLTCEVGVPGRVEEVHLDPVDRERRQARRDRELAGHLLGLEVHDGRALLDGSPPGDGTGGGQQGLGQGGLPAPWCPTRATLRMAVGSCGTWSSVLVLAGEVTPLHRFVGTSVRPPVRGCSGAAGRPASPGRFLSALYAPSA